MKDLLLSSALVAISLALFATGAAQADTAHQSFVVEPGDRLVVNTEWGAIEVHTWDRPEVELVVERADKLDLAYDQEAGTTTIQGRKKDAGLFDFFGLAKGRAPLFRLTVPHRHDLELSTSGGGIEVDDLLGRVSARTSGGSLSFGHIEGPIEGKTSGGSISLKGCSGTASVSTSGGSIRIGEVDGEVRAKTSGGSIHISRAQGSVQAKTSGGSIKVDEVLGPIDARTSGGSIRAQLSQQPHGPCHLKTSGGNVEVSLAADIGLQVDARTSGGRVSTDVPVVTQGTLDKNSLKAAINGGGPLMTLRTSGGSIHLRKL